MTAAAWQESWDRQQEAFLPDREHRFSVLLDVVDAVTDGQPMRVLDLAGGTGSISLRLLSRFPDVVTTVLDLDPVLQAIARATLPERATVVTGDLAAPGWQRSLPHPDYDAVLTATALHWLPPERTAELYAEVRSVLRPGGVFVNADHMADEGLPGLSARLVERAQARREARWSAGAALSWHDWWQRAAQDPVLGPLAGQRAEVFGPDHHSDSFSSVSWHCDALRSAGFAEVGLVWRGAVDAAVAAVR